MCVLRLFVKTDFKAANQFLYLRIKLHQLLMKRFGGYIGSPKATRKINQPLLLKYKMPV